MSLTRGRVCNFGCILLILVQLHTYYSTLSQVPLNFHIIPEVKAKVKHKIPKHFKINGIKQIKVRWQMLHGMYEVTVP